MSDSHDMTVPRPVLIGVALLLGLTIGAAALSRGSTSSYMPSASPTDQPNLRSRNLFFVDRPEGGVEVLDADTRESIHELTPGEDGFVRGAMRAIARGRRVQKFERQAPVRLILTADQALILSDPVTGRSVLLNAFGTTNVAAFARYLPETDQNSPRPDAKARMSLQHGS